MQRKLGGSKRGRKQKHGQPLLLSGDDSNPETKSISSWGIVDTPAALYTTKSYDEAVLCYVSYTTLNPSPSAAEAVSAAGMHK